MKGKNMQEIKKGKNNFYLGEESNPLASISFALADDDKIIIEHTVVSDSLIGQGIGGQLVSKVAEYARGENKKVIPHCSYAKKVMTQNNEYADILAK
jgi:predicted GNAT family acetyltransferase